MAKLYLSAKGRRALALVCLLGLLFPFFVILEKYNRISAIERAKQSAIAHVVSTNCSNHGLIEYEYFVAKKRYVGAESASTCGFDACANAKPGASFQISYSSYNANRSTCGSTHAEMSSLIFQIISLSVISYFLVIKIWRIIKSDEI